MLKYPFGVSYVLISAREKSDVNCSQLKLVVAHILEEHHAQLLVAQMLAEVV